MKGVMPPINTPDNVFRDGNPATGTQGDIVPALWLNNVQGATRSTQQELISVLSEAGIEVDENVNDQLLQAILQLTSTRSIPVGIPQPWPLSIPPAGWLKCNGATFDKVKYPLLASAYPSGTLPDLRAQFIRGWDDGRGMDTGRSLLSAQIGSKLRTCASTTTGSGSNGANIWHNTEFDQIETLTLYSVATNAAGLPFQVGIVRPHNVAFNYIVRAA